MLFARLGAAAARQFAADVTAEAYEMPGWTAADHSAALDVISKKVLRAAAVLTAVFAPAAAWHYGRLP